MDPIGIREIQEILRSATQKSLSHFHTAGMSSQQDVIQRPSIADAMDSKYTRKNTSMTFTIGSTDPRSFRKSVVGKTLQWFVLNVRSSITELPDRENVWYKVIGKNMHPGIVLRFYIDYRKILEYGLTLSELAALSFAGADWCVSPDFMGMIDVNLPDKYISPWLSRMALQVCGTFDITGFYKQSLSCVTSGSCILTASRAKGIDKPTITSNNVADVEENLGIEAASRALEEITGSTIVSDFITRTGSVLSFSKYSLEVPRKGLLTSIGFERPRDDIKNTIKSGSRWDSEYCSIYASVMSGTDPKLRFELLY